MGPFWRRRTSPLDWRSSFCFSLRQRSSTHKSSRVRFSIPLAVVAGARIEITGGDLTQPIVLSSDGQGKFASPELKPGSYSVRVVRDGFEPLVKAVDVRAAVELQLTLAIAAKQENISVTGKSMAFANSDKLYKQLRDVG